MSNKTQLEIVDFRLAISGVDL